MIIILEGENKTGKSTLAKYIVDHYDFDVIKCSQPKGDPYVEYMSILKQIEKSGRNTVIDRFAYGEFVYGPIYRGKSSLTKTQLRNIELKAISLNAHLIYCHDAVKNIKRRFLTEGEEFASTKHIAKTLQLFNEVMHEAIVPITYHRMQTKDDLTSEIETSDVGVHATAVVIEYKQLKKKDKRKRILLDNLINHLGHWDNQPRLKSAVGDQHTPWCVLVGEQANLRLKPEYKRFRQAFDFGVSAEYLFGELSRADVPVGRVMIMNSDSKELKAIPDEFTVIALGKVASKRLAKLDRDHYVLNHPSYERRFHGRKHRLAEIIGDILHGDYDTDQDE